MILVRVVRGRNIKTVVGIKNNSIPKKWSDGQKNGIVVIIEKYRDCEVKTS